MESQFKDKLKFFRKHQYLKQKDVAEAINVTPRVISSYETGTREPSIDIIVKLAGYFKITTDELLGVSEPIDTYWAAQYPKPPILEAYEKLTLEQRQKYLFDMEVQASANKALKDERRKNMPKTSVRQINEPKRLQNKQKTD